MRLADELECINSKYDSLALVNEELARLFECDGEADVENDWVVCNVEAQGDCLLGCLRRALMAPQALDYVSGTTSHRAHKNGKSGGSDDDDMGESVPSIIELRAILARHITLDNWQTVLDEYIKTGLNNGMRGSLLAQYRAFQLNPENLKKLRKSDLKQMIVDRNLCNLKCDRCNKNHLSRLNHHSKEKLIEIVGNSRPTMGEAYRKLACFKEFVASSKHFVTARDIQTIMAEYPGRHIFTLNGMVKSPILKKVMESPDYEKLNVGERYKMECDYNAPFCEPLSAPALKTMRDQGHCFIFVLLSNKNHWELVVNNSSIYSMYRWSDLPRTLQDEMVCWTQ